MWVHAQTTPRGIEQVIIVDPQTAGTVIAGPDLGFRIERHKGKTPVGRLVVRIDRQWVEVEDAVVMKKLTTR
jgi:hypothetical protein